jgi:hypothetical protein
MIRMGFFSSKDLEVAFGKTRKPVPDRRLRRGERPPFRFLRHPFTRDQANDPAGESPGRRPVFVYPLGDKLGFAATDPVTSRPVPYAQRFVEPSLFPEKLDKPAKEIPRASLPADRGRINFAPHGASSPLRTGPEKYRLKIANPAFPCQAFFRPCRFSLLAMVLNQKLGSGAGAAARFAKAPAGIFFSLGETKGFPQREAEGLRPPPATAIQSGLPVFLSTFRKNL